MICLWFGYIFNFKPNYFAAPKPDPIPTQNPPVPKELSRSAQKRRERAEERTHDDTIMNLPIDEGKIIVSYAASRGNLFFSKFGQKWYLTAIGKAVKAESFHPKFSRQ